MFIWVLYPKQNFHCYSLKYLAKIFNLSDGVSIQDAGKAIGRSGDEGIDGIIKEDRLSRSRGKNLKP
ncbi:hypothetical protein ABRG53_3612 [Pseudanabaena sp. ABRG5-3]|nr:hypothetical protein ABRG53_3612 [Pseudanabaena sp. ABRG5-3]